jgi:hypothetical protein
MVVCLVLSARAIAATANSDVYVSPLGNDSNLGTAQSPVHSLPRALRLASAYGKSAHGDIIVHLAPGTYRLAETLQIPSVHSARSSARLVIESDKNESTTISGAVAVTGWTLIDSKRNIWSAPAPDAVRNTRQLYVDGVRAIRTCGPVPANLTQTATGYAADNDTMAHWRNASDIEFVYTGGNGLWGTGSYGLGAWTEPRCPVAIIDGTTITMAQPCWDNSTKRIPLAPSFHSARMANLVGPGSVGKRPATVENAYELLGTPGQFYLDRPSRTFYYVPRTGEDLSKADVEVPILETLISGAGTPDHPVTNVVFSGITFACTTWLGPCGPDGFSEIQANYQVTGIGGWQTQGLCELAPKGTCPFGAWTQEPGSVSFAYDHGIEFTDCNFAHLGSAGLLLGDGSQGDTVDRCVFTDISGNGIELGGVDQPIAAGANVTSDNTIEDSHFYNVATEYHGGVGIDIGYARNSLVAHNQLDHLPYSGISVGWGGWLDKINKPGVANFSANNVISSNLIFDHLLLLADGGGIYTQGITGPSITDGEKVTGNVVRDQFGSGHAIYCDNGSANMTVAGNVVFHTNFDNWGTAHKDYYNGHQGDVADPFVVEGNYWQQSPQDSARPNLTIKDNHIIARLSDAPREIIERAGIEPACQADVLGRNLCTVSAPCPPMRLSAIAGDDDDAYVAFSPPTFEGTSPITSFTAKSSTGIAATVSLEAFESTGYIRVAGLTAGTPCCFSVTATNDWGTSAQSLPSRDITPASGQMKLPGAPTLLGIAAGTATAGTASVHFEAPADNGGGPIIGYSISASPAGKSLAISGRTTITLSGKHATCAVIDGLPHGTTQTISIAAINPAGTGPAATSELVIP